MLHAVRFINTSSLISGTAYPGMARGQSGDPSPSQSAPSTSAANQNRNLISSRFGFLSCITGFTSICLLGLTLSSLAPGRGGKTKLHNRVCPPVDQPNWDHCQSEYFLPYFSTKIALLIFSGIFSLLLVVTMRLFYS